MAEARFAASHPKYQWEDISLVKSDGSDWAPHDLRIAQWCNHWFGKILRKERPLPKSCPHLALIGSANSGKTRLANHISTLVPTCFYVPDNGYMDGLLDQHELVYFDDFNGSHMKYGDFKKFTGGSSQMLRLKGKPARPWNKNIPMIFTANEAPYHWWNNIPIEHHVLDSRLFVVVIPDDEKVSLFDFKYGEQDIPDFLL